MNDSNNKDEIARLKNEISLLKLQLEETTQLAKAKEKVLNANIAEQERLYDDLSKKLKDIRTKGYEIKVLNALNQIIATASKYISLDDILQPTLRVLISSVETLLNARGQKVSISGGIFLLDAERNCLTVSALHTIKPEALGCKGTVQAGECLCGMAAVSKDVISSPYCMADPRHTRILANHHAEEHAHVTIPLKSGDKLVGVIFLYVSPPGYEPSPADIAIFNSIGSYFGLHIEKARLYGIVENLATHDGLTGLLNRREFEHCLNTEFERAKRYSREMSLLLLDIDHFKQCNDTYGHQFGDKVLTTMGSLVKQSIRGSDMAARYGGEEVTVIMPETNSEHAAKVAERLRKRVEMHAFKTQEKSVNLTISIGAASFPSHAGTTVELVKAADRALYFAKETGRNRVCRFDQIKEDEPVVR